jgi:hypothetical protein
VARAGRVAAGDLRPEPRASCTGDLDQHPGGEESPRRKAVIARTSCQARRARGHPAGRSRRCTRRAPNNAAAAFFDTASAEPARSARWADSAGSAGSDRSTASRLVPHAAAAM